jgi:hypothetical protein
VKESRVPTIALVCIAYAAILAIILVILLIGETVHLDGAATQEGSTRVSLIILLFGQAVMTVLFAAFLFIGIEDWRHNIPLSSLYPPQVAVMSTLAAYMTVLGMSVIDLLTHHLRPTWSILYTPVARIFQSILLLLVFASFAWVLATIVRGRTAARRTLALGNTLAQIARRLLRIEERVRAEEARNDAVERAATAAHARADLAETRADQAHERADLSDETLDDHEGRLEVVEEVTEITHTITKKQDGAP